MIAYQPLPGDLPRPRCRAEDTDPKTVGHPSIICWDWSPMGLSGQLVYVVSRCMRDDSAMRGKAIPKIRQPTLFSM
jgi:hypothetical protein